MFNSHEKYYWTLLFTVSPSFLRSVWLVKLLSTMVILRPRDESLHHNQEDPSIAIIYRDKEILE